MIRYYAESPLPTPPVPLTGRVVLMGFLIIAAVVAGVLAIVFAFVRLRAEQEALAKADPGSQEAARAVRRVDSARENLKVSAVLVVFGVLAIGAVLLFPWLLAV